MVGDGKMSGVLVTVYEMYNQYSLWLSALIGGKAKGHWLWVKQTQNCHNQYSHTVTDRRKGVLVMGTVTISTRILPLSPLTGGEHWLWVKHKLSQSVLPYCHYQYWQEAKSTGYKWNINCPIRTRILSLSPLTGDKEHWLWLKLSNQNSHTVTISTDRRWGALVMSEA